MKKINCVLDEATLEVLNGTICTNSVEVLCTCVFTFLKIIKLQHFFISLTMTHLVPFILGADFNFKQHCKSRIKNFLVDLK